MTEPFLYQGGYTLVSLSAAVILLASLERQWFAHRVLRWRVLGVIGMVSYGLYLWHLPVFTVVSRHGHDLSRSQRTVVGLSITAAAVAFSWFVIERPALRWKDRLEARSAARRDSSPIAPAVDVPASPPTSAGAG
jgi:peptidoglycan/LPS O-acetylase OafA/YrhL